MLNPKIFSILVSFIIILDFSNVWTTLQHIFLKKRLVCSSSLDLSSRKIKEKDRE